MKRFLIVVMITTLLAGFNAGPATAQGEDDCADVAGNGYQVCGAFRTYWEDGGADFLGSPLGDAFDEVRLDSGAVHPVQYFAVGRVEQHPDQAGTPYDLQLGRLGAEVLAARGRDWRAFPQSDPAESHYFDQTGFAIAPEFIVFWTSHGQDLGDRGISFRESLALFGYPLSRAEVESNAGGEAVLTQWFERARFELRDGEVVLAPLGVELLDIPGAGNPAQAAMLAQVRQATAGYAETATAQGAGWDLAEGFDDCIDNPGVGAMGYHYVNASLLDATLDPLMPEALVYQVGDDGQRSLGAVEWVVPADVWDAGGHAGPPEVLGHPLHLSGDASLYVLHAWIYLENPAGIFEDWNPDVNCAVGG